MDEEHGRLNEEHLSYTKHHNRRCMHRMQWTNISKRFDQNFG